MVAANLDALTNFEPGALSTSPGQIAVRRVNMLLADYGGLPYEALRLK